MEKKRRRVGVLVKVRGVAEHPFLADSIAPGPHKHTPGIRFAFGGNSR